MEISNFFCIFAKSFENQQRVKRKKDMESQKFDDLKKGKLPKVVMIPLNRLEGNNGQIPGVPANPRRITKEKYDRLKKSIQDDPEFLLIHPAIVMPFNNVYVTLCGNMRLRAVTDLGYEELPCTVLPADTPVEKQKAYATKDNNSFGEWDWDMIANDWSDMPLLDWGMDFPEDWLEGNKNDDSKQAKDDDFDPDAEAPKRCSLGDIWQLGRHRLLVGDSTDPEQLGRLMDGKKADLWLTDPPYNVNYQGGTDEKMKIQNDNMSSEDFFAFLSSAFKAADQYLKAGGVFYIWFASREHINFEKALNEAGFQVRQELIWVKNSLVMGRQDYQWRHEPCLTGWKSGASHNWYSDRSQTTVMEFDKPTKCDLHPTMKPVPLFAYQIKNSTKEEDIVLDTFGGSGTTIIACEQINRCGYCCELDPVYADRILARWEKLTGLTATKIG